MYDELKDIIKGTENIVFFGGAGVSTESGIPDFRSAMGLYNEKTERNYSPEEILSHSFFEHHTEDFYRFYREKMIYKDALPNDAHLALRKLEEMGKLKAIVTQNIDGLHQAAGSKNVLELHGSIQRNHCLKCGKKFVLEYIVESESMVPHCNDCGGKIKPDVVLYGEGLDMNIVDRAIHYISKTDVLIIGGTSLVVYPAAGLIRYFGGNKLILINKTSTAYDNKANLIISESIGKVLAEVVRIQ